MPFAFDGKTKTITMAVGDTATIGVNVQWDRLKAGDVVLFAVFDSSGDLLCKAAEITDGQARIRLCNHDTRDIKPGKYSWNLRIVTSPAQDEAGNVYADECSDNVITVFDHPPAFKLKQGGARV